MRSTVSGRTLPPAWPCNNIAGSGDINRAGHSPQVAFPLSLSKLTRRDARARFSSLDTNRKIASTSSSSVPTAAQELVEYLNESWTSYHATATAARMLSAAGYIRLREQDEWKILPGGKYFLTRNMSSVVAFGVGEKYEPGKGFHIIGAHTDSPCPKLKPVSALSKGGFLGVGVQTYGGGLWHTWFDRDLSVAGKVVLRRSASGGCLSQELVRIDRPILRIPTLAIHLDRNVNTEGFKLNAETHLAPILSTAIKGDLEIEVAQKTVGNKAGQGTENRNDAPVAHHPLLLALLAEQLDCNAHEIIDFDLQVCDVQPSVIGGAACEFIFSGRLDNLASSFCALKALLEGGEDGSLANENSIRMIALFDNEEVGSGSTTGAAGSLLADVIRRTLKVLCRGSDQEGLSERSLRRSFLVSADMAHALHPNYLDKHEGSHAPKLHSGLVVKHNANQRYATNAVTATLFRECAAQSGIPTQDFVVRNDMGCGSTIGPILSANLGIRTVDVGVPQLSMHSVRELCGTEDIEICYRHFRAFFENFATIDAKFADIDS